MTVQIRGRSRRLARRDLVWRDNEVAWGVQLPNPPAVARAVSALADAFRSEPTSHFFRYLDAERGTWRPVAVDKADEFADQVVVGSDLQLSAQEFAAEVTRSQLDPLGDLPFRLTLGSDWAILRFTHALGDAGTMWAIFMGLLEPGSLQSCMHHAPDARAPLINALWQAVRHDRARVLAAIRGTRTPFPLKDGGTLPFQVGDVAVIARRSEEGFRKKLAVSRKAEAPGSSAVGVLVARAMVAAAQHGLRPYPGVGLGADARRFLPSRQFRSGNFTAAAYLGLDHPQDPLAVTEAIAGYAQSARPLLTLALMAAKARRGPRTSTRWVSPDGDRSLISFSHVGRFPWLTTPPTTAVVLGKPVGPYGIAIVTFEIRPFTYASVTYDPRTVRAEVAEAIADRMIS